EIGRKAIADGKGILDMAAVHQDALVTVLPKTIKRGEIEETLKKAAQFFSESIAPFEMTFRGFQDSITGLYNLNKTLEQSEMKFRSVVQAANDAIISGRSNGSIISWNKCAETIFGYSEEEVL
ncbi:MAG: PAS domain S-box protein, partial [Candidatus Methanoperedens sp.]|nr:PAS domain S-box protein [Candidatus Methanoperedens sp.]